MKRNSFLIFSILIFVTLWKLNAQCPNSVNISAGDKCLYLIWNTPPNPLPASLIYNGTTYNYQSGAGTSSSPALYQENVTPNCGSSSTFTGSITIGGQICNYTNGILPLKLLDFKVFTENGNNILVWKTIDEINVKSIQIERAEETFNWELIGEIKSDFEKISDCKSYKFIDEEPIKQTNYYRLKITDKDGMFEYSKILVFNNQNAIDKELSIYPVPANDRLFIYSDAKIIKCELFDFYGKKITEYSHLVDNINISSLKNGIYIASFHCEDGSRILRKFAKK